MTDGFKPWDGTVPRVTIPQKLPTIRGYSTFEWVDAFGNVQTQTVKHSGYDGEEDEEA